MTPCLHPQRSDMKDKKIITHRQLQELGQALLDDEPLDGVWTPGVPGANVSAVVDPQVDDAEPINPCFTPQDKVEFEVAVRNLVRGLPNESMPELFTALRAAIKASSEEAEEDTQMKQSKKNEKITKAVEEALRVRVRQLLREIRPLPHYPGGADFWGERGEEDGPKGKKYMTMSDVGGAPLKDIADELGGSVAGARRISRESVKKAQFVSHVMDQDELERVKGVAMEEYIEKLESVGDLSKADEHLLMNNPDIVMELDGFREFLDKYIKKSMKEYLASGWNWSEEKGWTQE